MSTDRRSTREPPIVPPPEKVPPVAPELPTGVDPLMPLPEDAPDAPPMPQENARR